MKILTCFIAPTSGQVSVAGHDIFGEPLEVRRRVGYLPENAPLYPDMRVVEYLDFVGEVRSMPRKERASAMDRVIAECGLAEVVDREIRNLSKGYRQRAGLAQAMMHDPQILILDEPTSGLDPNQIAEIRDLIRKMGRERTVILSTHHLAEVEATADRVLIVHQGKLVADGTPRELERQRGGALYELELARPAAGEEAVREVFSGIDGVRSVEILARSGADELSLALKGESAGDLRARIFSAVVDNGWVLLGLGRRQVDLEGIFRSLTTGGGGKEVA
jgi:ABC-2 type transport system ATP-binding protein